MSALEARGNLVKQGKTIPSFFNAPEKLRKAEECTSTPTELLAEFLFSIMTKNYEKALKYCTQILNYEPYNLTVRKFYPLIVEELQMKLECSSSDSSDGYSSESSESSESEILKMKKFLQESGESCRSSEDKAIENINDYFSSNLMNSEMNTKNRETTIKDVKKPLKERN